MTSTRDERPKSTEQDGQQPVPEAFRPSLEGIVRAFASGDYDSKQAVPNVEPIRSIVAQQAREFVEDFGETLVELPEQAWVLSSSTDERGSQEILVDLWTAESGSSDCVGRSRARHPGRVPNRGDGAVRSVTLRRIVIGFLRDSLPRGKVVFVADGTERNRMSQGKTGAKRRAVMIFLPSRQAAVGCCVWAPVKGSSAWAGVCRELRRAGESPSLV